MSEFWNEKFGWLENEPLTDEERQNLTPRDRIIRELVMSKYMSAYKGRWIIVKDQVILASGDTPADVANRKQTETADFVMRVPTKNYKSQAFLAEAA
jgi:hypothetical protein